MNIQERNQYIGLHNQLMDLGKLNDNLTSEFINANVYWDRLSRPPIYQYIPQYVFNKLHEYLNNKRLYNRPKERFKLVNELLEPIGLKPLASGTNRRTFYCTYDPNIVFKLASDSVGMSDNLNEFTMQQLLKPFFAKMFSVTPDGLLSLSERVETMKEVDYKQIWSEYIFKIINDLLSRGYIMEDIGSNFFKNWGIRIGYGPVLLDCPYIYKVDTNRLKCPRIDKNTGEICNGEIDYDYEKGMSEIICTKCGTRYYASELAQVYPSESFTKIVKGRDYRMGIIDTNVKVQITKGDQVINRYFVETDSQEFSSNQGPRRVTVDEFNPNKVVSTNTFPHVQTNIHSVVTNVTHNIPFSDNNLNNNFNVNEYTATNYILFDIEIPLTLINTIKTNCNLDLTKLSEDDLYTCLTKNTTQDYWISHMSSEEYKIFSDFSNKFISNYLNKVSYSTGNGDPLINIFGSFIYKSIISKIEKALNVSFNLIPDVNVLYNQLTNENSVQIIKNTLSEKEYLTFKGFIATLAALNIDKISFINSEISSFTFDLVKLCDKPINKILYQKLENITQLQFSKINDNASLAKYLISSSNNISNQLSGIELSQFQFFILSLSQDQNQTENITNNIPLIQQQDSQISIPFTEIDQTKVPIQTDQNVVQEQKIENSGINDNIINEAEEKKELEKIITESPENNIEIVEEKPKKLIQVQTISSTGELVDSVNKELLKDKNLDENGNTIGRIADWTEFYRNFKKYTLYPKDVKNDIIYFLKRVENKFGYTSAEFIANKLQIKYIKADEYDKDKDQASIKPTPITTNTETKRAIEQQVEEVTSNPKPEDKISNKYSISTQTDPSPSQKLINPELDWKTRTEEVPELDKTFEIDTEKEYFVEKAKTPEELSAIAEAKLQTNNSVVGIIGEPKVDSLRNKELIPILKDKVFAKFNNIELDNNVDMQIKDLQKYVKQYIFEELKLITRDDGSGIAVKIIRDADERNRDCFKIYVSNNNSALFEVVIYPAKNNSITEQKTIRDRYSSSEVVETPDFDVYQFLNNEKELYIFLNKKINEYDMTQLKSIEEAKTVLVAYLYSVLTDHIKGKASSPLVMKICKDYVLNQCTIDMNGSEQQEEPQQLEENVEIQDNESTVPSAEDDKNTIADQI